MGMRDALDDPVEKEAAKVVCQFSGGVIGWIDARQLRHQDTHFRVGEPAELKTENNQHGERSLDAFVTEA
jgi:hypothetical protein